MNNKLLVGIALVLVAFGTGYALSQKGDTPQGSNQTTTTPAPSESDTSSGKTVDLSGQQLTTIPDSVLSQTNITELNLSNNQIVTLPGEISELKNLVTLNIENNRLESFPSQISDLKKLRDIRANNNRLTRVDELSSMTWLSNVDISGSNLPSNTIQMLKTALPDTQIKS